MCAVGSRKLLALESSQYDQVRRRYLPRTPYLPHPTPCANNIVSQQITYSETKKW